MKKILRMKTDVYSKKVTRSNKQIKMPILKKLQNLKNPPSDVDPCIYLFSCDAAWEHWTAHYIPYSI